MDRPPILIVKTGSAVPPVVADHGDFDLLIARGLGLEVDATSVVEVSRGQPLPLPREVGGAIVTGSSAMVSAPEPWAERTAAWLCEAVAVSLPVLGICYGHQLLARALGGTVGANPNGREIGTVEVELGEAAGSDRLLGGLGPRLVVQETHVESVLSLPPGARLLGGNRHDPHQAFAVADTVWGVQFHPELDAAVIRRYITERREAISEEGLDPDRLFEGAADSQDGQAILRRFAEIVAG